MKFLASLFRLDRHHACRAAALGCVVGASALSWAAGGEPSVSAGARAAPSSSPSVPSLLLAVNQYRRQHSQLALQSAPELERLALQHSSEMATLRRASHAGFKARFERSDSDLCVENVAVGFASADAAVDGWRASPAHDRNLLEPRLRRVGIASVDGYVTLFACETAGVPAPPLKGRWAASR